MSEASMQVSRQSLAEQVAQGLTDYIFREGLVEGDALPSTIELSQRFGVSRTVVREALASLAGRGMLVRSQGRESVVASPGPEDLMRVLQFRMYTDDLALVHLLDIRRPIESMSARRAAENATPEHLQAIKAAMDDLAGAKSDASYHRSDMALHRAIAVASGNPMIVLILDALVDSLHALRVTATKSRRARGESLDPIIEQHRAIVRAIEERDCDAAEQAMTTHLAASASEIVPS